MSIKAARNAEQCGERMASIHHQGKDMSSLILEDDGIKS